MAATNSYAVTTEIDDNFLISCCRNDGEFVISVKDLKAQMFHDVVTYEMGVENAGRVLFVGEDGRVTFSQGGDALAE